MSTAAKTISITGPQRVALIWAINIWEASMEGYEEECDEEMRASIRGARRALVNLAEAASA